jgi:hypothetical protein
VDDRQDTKQLFPVKDVHNLAEFLHPFARRAPIINPSCTNCTNPLDNGNDNDGDVNVGVVHANVGQKLLKRNIISNFCTDRS